MLKKRALCYILWHNLKNQKFIVLKIKVTPYLFDFFM